MIGPFLLFGARSESKAVRTHLVEVMWSTSTSIPDNATDREPIDREDNGYPVSLVGPLGHALEVPVQGEGAELPRNVVPNARVEERRISVLSPTIWPSSSRRSTRSTPPTDHQRASTTSGEAARSLTTTTRRDGVLSPVIDFGCSAIGDPACDTVLAWTFLNGDSRRAFRDRLPVDEGRRAGDPRITPGGREVHLRLTTGELMDEFQAGLDADLEADPLLGGHDTDDEA